MNGFNRIFVLGRLGADPTSQQSRNGRTFTKLSIATNRAQHDEGGEKTITDWYNVNVWGRQGELCSRYLRKGQGVVVEGYLSTYQVMKEDEKPETRIAINAQKVEFLSRPSTTASETETESSEIMH
jgi:single-strand DNA-binding protein